MIRRGGIDSQIEQRKMQFGENPQALQQRYGQSKQLLDLLALQQIAEEQKQKSQMMQMQMQQNPATIAEQVEQEALQGKKAEMAQSLQGMQAMRAPKRSQSETARGVAGALAQKQREQQSRMQRMAGSGVAGQRARNMERMYDGGIVGYSNGDLVVGDITQDELDYYMSRNPEMSRDQAIQRLKRRGKGLRMAETFLGKRREASAAARRERRAQDEAVQEERRQQQSKQRAREEGYDVEGLDLTDIRLPEKQKAPTSAVTKEPLREEPLREEPRKEVSTIVPQKDTVLARQEELLQELMPEQVSTAAPTEPGLMERKARQEQELLAAGEDILGTPQLGGLEAIPRQPQVPEMLKRPSGTPAQQPQAPTTRDRLQELLDEQLSLYKRQKSELDEEQSIFDILTGAARRVGGQKTNRGAAAAFLGGISEEIADEKERKKTGLAKLQERLGTNLTSQLALEQGLAQIKRGEEQTDIAREQLSQQDRQFMRTFGLDERRVKELSRQFDITSATQGKQLAANILRNMGQTRYEQAQVRLSEDRNRITEELGRATETGRRNSLVSELRKNSTTQTDNLREAMNLALEALPTSQEYVNADAEGKKKMVSDIREAYDLEIKAYQDETTQLIKDLTGVDVPVSPLRSAPKSGGTSGFSIKSVR
jgi:hypothetical protein